jgi:hypothetical protein
MIYTKTILVMILSILVVACSTNELSNLILEGQDLHISLKTRQLDNTIRHVPIEMIPANPHASSKAGFIEAIARSGSQSRLGSEGIISALYALYFAENELGFYGLEAASKADADRLEQALRNIWAKNVSIKRAQVHRVDLNLVVVWTDGVSSECWEAVNAKVAARLGL